VLPPGIEHCIGDHFTQVRLRFLPLERPATERGNR
jgi:hypothetical protein